MKLPVYDPANYRLLGFLQTPKFKGEKLRMGVSECDPFSFVNLCGAADPDAIYRCSSVEFTLGTSSHIETRTATKFYSEEVRITRAHLTTEASIADLRHVREFSLPSRYDSDTEAAENRAAAIAQYPFLGQP